MIKIIASSVITLDSHVKNGGGTDVTEALQNILDKAPENGGLHLVMDGAALVRGLVVHSNTIIECVNRDCGFYLADNSNRPILRNYNWSGIEINTRNVTLSGGTYNHNCPNQEHHVSSEDFPLPELPGNTPHPAHGINLLEFFGIENFIIRDVFFTRQRSFTLTLGNFKNVVIENSFIDMDAHVHPSNQDGFHFFGPGQFLTMRNVGGCTGDDFINIAPDELDQVSSITDVLIDGVFFDDVCQGIRMLSRGTGLLDRVTVRNVTGTYRTFAFSIEPFFRGETFGKYGDILIENVDLRQIEATYHYTPLTFMQLGGNMDCITLKNVRFRNPVRNSTFIELGRPFFYRPEELTDEEVEKYMIDDMETYGTDRDWMPEGKRPVIKNFTLSDVIIETDDAADEMKLIEAKYNITNLMLSGIKVFRPDATESKMKFLKLSKEADIGKLFAENIYAEKLESFISGENGEKIGFFAPSNVILRDCDKMIDETSVTLDECVEYGD